LPILQLDSCAALDWCEPNDSLGSASPALTLGRVLTASLSLTATASSRADRNDIYRFVVPDSGVIALTIGPAANTPSAGLDLDIYVFSDPPSASPVCRSNFTGVNVETIRFNVPRCGLVTNSQLGSGLYFVNAVIVNAPAAGPITYTISLLRE
jgi:hypothetical protein